VGKDLAFPPVAANSGAVAPQPNSFTKELLLNHKHQPHALQHVQ
jgi:hypothetical protein